MKKRIFFLVLLLATFLSACNFPLTGSTVNSANTWIDAPLHGSQLPLEPYRVVMHATGPENITQFELSVNGVVETRVQANHPNTMLFQAEYWWLPPDNGEYVLEARAMNDAGLPSAVAEVTVTVGEQYALSEYTPFDPASEDGDDPDIDDAIADDSVTPETPITPITPEAPVCVHKLEWLNQGQPEVYTSYGNENFTVKWVLKNAGNCAWEATYKLVQVDSPSSTNNFVAKELPIGKRIEAGSLLEIEMLVTAPADGSGRLNWMLSDGKQTFGLGQEARTAFWFEYEVQGRAGDNEPPVFTASNISPAGPIQGQDITVYVEAADNVAVTQIKIVFTQGNNVQERSCFNKSACTVILGGWSVGTISIDAFAYDASGNVGQLGARNVRVAAVITPTPTTIARDLTPPSMTYEILPKNPNEEQQITVRVSATDNDRVALIEIVFTPKDSGRKTIKHVCRNTNTCEFKGYLPYGDWVVNIIAKDPSGNSASIFPFVLHVAAVIK